MELLSFPKIALYKIFSFLLNTKIAGPDFHFRSINYTYTFSSFNLIFFGFLFFYILFYSILKKHEYFENHKFLIERISSILKIICKHGEGADKLIFMRVNKCDFGRRF